MLSEKVKDLIEKSRIVSFTNWKERYPQDAIAVWSKVDRQKVYLSDRDIETIKEIIPNLEKSLEKTKILRDNVAEIVDKAREEVLRTFPDLIKPGGGLYPPVRAEACWRDFWHFLRCISYGIGGESVDYLSKEGLGYMEKLYQELQVPQPAMVLGLENLKKYSLQKFSEDERNNLAPYFDRLIAELKQFA